MSLRPSRHPDNTWRIVHPDAEAHPGANSAANPIEYLTDGAKIRLEHTSTSRRLHSHNVRPPISQDEFQNEVSAYRDPGFEGDENDDWIVETDSGGQVKAISTIFRLRHAVEGCYLSSNRVMLPRWGLEQQEVICNKNPADRASTLWFIETNTHPRCE